MQYRYRALNTQGKVVSGDYQANDPAEMLALLKNEGLELIHCTPKARPRLRLGRSQQLSFFFQLAHLTAAGLPLVEALADIGKNESATAPGRLAAELTHELHGGQSFSQALSKSNVFSDRRILNLIQAGEQAGQLTESLEEICRTLHWEQALINNTQKLLIYPAIASSVILASTLFLLLYLAPQLRPFILGLGHDLPWATRSLFACVAFLQNHGPQVLLVAIAGGLLMHQLFKRQPFVRLWIDRSLLRLPLLGEILRKLATLRLANTLAALYRAGIPILSALECLPGVLHNRWLVQSLEQSRTAITQGSALSTAFAQDQAFSPLLVRMLRLGEQSGQLEQALAQLEKVYSREIQLSIDRLQASIEPILSLFLGLMLAWVSLALIAPIYDIVAKVPM